MFYCILAKRQIEKQIEHQIYEYTCNFIYIHMYYIGRLQVNQVRTYNKIFSIFLQYFLFFN